MPTSKKISITLTSDLVSLLRNAVTNGYYSSASEVVRDALRDWKIKQSLNEKSTINLKALSREGMDIKHSDSKDSVILCSYDINQENDDLYKDAVLFVTEFRKASISDVQRRFKIGYNRAALIIKTMEDTGVISCANSGGLRFVLAPAPIID